MNSSAEVMEPRPIWLRSMRYTFDTSYHSPLFELWSLAVENLILLVPNSVGFKKDTKCVFAVVFGNLVVPLFESPIVITSSPTLADEI